MRNDKDVFLWIAEGGDVESFAQASSHLRSQKAFMMKCVSLNPQTFRYAFSEELRKDFDLVTVAAAGSLSDAPQVLRAHLEDDDIANYIQRAHSKILLNETFVNTIISGAALTRNDRCHLRRVIANQGVETNGWFKETIAQDLDVPDRNNVRLIRRALSNISGEDSDISDDENSSISNEEELF